MRGWDAVPHIDKWREGPARLNSVLGFGISKAMMGAGRAKGYMDAKFNNNFENMWWDDDDCLMKIDL